MKNLADSYALEEVMDFIEYVYEEDGNIYVEIPSNCLHQAISGDPYCEDILSKIRFAVKVITGKEVYEFV